MKSWTIAGERRRLAVRVPAGAVTDSDLAPSKAVLRRAIADRTTRPDDRSLLDRAFEGARP